MENINRNFIDIQKWHKKINCNFQKTPIFWQLISTKNSFKISFIISQSKMMFWTSFLRNLQQTSAWNYINFGKYTLNSFSYSSYACLAIQICPRNRLRELQWIGFHCLLSNQFFDVLKLPNKNIFIEKLQFIVLQSKFSNSWLKILFKLFLYIWLEHCSKTDRRNQVLPLTKVLELFLNSLANVILILHFVFDVFCLYNSYLWNFGVLASGWQRHYLPNIDVDQTFSETQFLNLAHKGDKMLFVNEVNIQHCIHSTNWCIGPLKNATFLYLQAV